jgi:hypothetical protein
MDSMKELIVFIIIFIIWLILYKKGIVRFKTTTYYGKYRMKRSTKHLKMDYRKFDGTEYFNFKFKEGQKITMTYSVIVERGTLKLILNDKNDEIFTKTFHSNESGEFTFTTVSKRYSITLESNDTKGSCEIQFQ